MRIDLARMNDAARLDESEHGFHLGAGLGRFGRHGARMHERMMIARQESVVDEKVFFQPQLRVEAFQIACPVSRHPMAQGQVLRPSGRADGIRLDESQFMNRSLERGRLEQRARNRITAQMVQSDGHATMISNRRGDAGRRRVSGGEGRCRGRVAAGFLVS